MVMLKLCTGWNLRRAAVCGVLAACAFGSAPAMAAEPDNAVTGILGMLGIDNSSPGIDYRERSPLVIPPSNQLPQPQGAASDPNWPVEADVKRQRALEAAGGYDGANTSERFRQNALPLPIGEIEKGRTKVKQHNSGSKGGNDFFTPLSPSELGTKQGLFSTLFEKEKTELAPFTGEPTRTNLASPPAGYQTPSPNQPYGLAKEKYRPQAEDSFTQHGMNIGK